MDHEIAVWGPASGKGVCRGAVPDHGSQANANAADCRPGIVPCNRPGIVDEFDRALTFQEFRGINLALEGAHAYEAGNQNKEEANRYMPGIFHHQLLDKKFFNKTNQKYYNIELTNGIFC
jgi:hypothetical protein